MLNITIENAEGNRRFFKSATGIKKHTSFGIQKALYKVGKDLLATFNQQVLDKNKTGIIYIRRDRLGRRRRHQSSASGESPANRTGFYRKSAGFNVNGSNELIFGDSAEYAGFLELGTSRMKPRPGLGRAVDANTRNILRHLSGQIEDKI